MGGFIDVIILLTFFGFLLLTGVLAANATLSKRQSKKVKFEPVSFFITLTTLLSLVYSLTLRGHTNGDEWVNAQNWNQRNSLSTQNLTLRKNGNFTLSLSEVDIGCSISGSYVKKGDTIILDKATIDKTDNKMTTPYLLHSEELVPLFDTVNKWRFTITE